MKRHQLRIKRVYKPPDGEDGVRVLVDRLWPRGLTKAAAAIDHWFKELAPSTDLRRWFDHRADRWAEFQKRYAAELDGNRPAWLPILEAAERGTVTLLFSTHDVEHNNAVALRAYVKAKKEPR